MKFAVPHTHSDEQAEQIWANLRSFLTQLGFSTTERRIQKVYFRRNGKDYEAEVGEVFRDLREKAIIILEAACPKLIYLCTTNRGVVRGKPYPIDARDPDTYIVDFDKI